MKIINHVQGTSKFDFYREGNLYYTTDTGITFPVPISDTTGATFFAEDRTLFFMRWLRKHLDLTKVDNERRTVPTVPSKAE